MPRSPQEGPIKNNVTRNAATALKPLSFDNIKYLQIYFLAFCCFSGDSVVDYAGLVRLDKLLIKTKLRVLLRYTGGLDRPTWMHSPMKKRALIWNFQEFHNLFIFLSNHLHESRSWVPRSGLSAG